MPEPQTFFTADTHFGHAGIIRHCFRGFASVAEMDEAIIANWNARVGRHDTVWHLGDFTLAGASDAASYRARLNGKIHLIWGNHDRPGVRHLPCWASSGPMAEVSVAARKLILCHYALRVWDGCGRGALMLYGHSHGNLPGSSQSLDVGQDAWAYRPVTLPEIMDRMATLPAFRAEDHHARAA